MTKKGAKPETRHLAASIGSDATVCGRPTNKVLLWAKRNPPKADDTTVCGRCRKLAAGHAEKIERAHSVIPGAKEQPKAAQKMIRTLGEELRKRIPGKRTPALASLEVAPKELVVTYKGTEHKALVNEDGTITVNDKTFNSPSRAGKEITGREVDGWNFWSVSLMSGTMVKLDALRKATTNQQERIPA